jgi:hypothetical protein
MWTWGSWWIETTAVLPLRLTTVTTPSGIGSSSSSTSRRAGAAGSARPRAAAGRPATPTAVEQVTENLGGGLVGRFEEVGIDIERRGGVRVAEPPGNGLDRDAGREESGSSEVA